MSTGAYKTRTQKRRGMKIDEKLLDALSSIIPKNETVVDIGAGCGVYVGRLREMGYEATGLDGTPGVSELSGGLVLQQDLTECCVNWYRAFDWAYFIEVGEHIPKKFEEMVFYNVSKIPTKGLIVSWASEGQRGRGHTNCQDPIYVASKFGNRGWVVDPDLTRLAKSKAGRSYRKRIMVLRNYNA